MTTRKEFGKTLDARMSHASGPSVDRLRAAIRSLYGAIVVECLTLPGEAHQAAVAGQAAQRLYDCGADLANEFRP